MVGGPHPTTAEEMMQQPCIDAVVIGEGEQTTVKLLPMLLSGASEHFQVLGFGIRRHNIPIQPTPTH